MGMIERLDSLSKEHTKVVEKYNIIRCFLETLILESGAEVEGKILFKNDFLINNSQVSVSLFVDQSPEWQKENDGGKRLYLKSQTIGIILQDIQTNVRLEDNIEPSSTIIPVGGEFSVRGMTIRVASIKVEDLKGLAKVLATSSVKD